MNGQLATGNNHVNITIYHLPLTGGLHWFTLYKSQGSHPHTTNKRPPTEGCPTRPPLSLG